MCLVLPLPSLPDYVIYTQLKLPTSSLARCHLLLVLYRCHPTDLLPPRFPVAGLSPLLVFALFDGGGVG
jgi:hypothetical protein